jgi:hypothetical protein
VRYISVGEKLFIMDDKTLAARLRANFYRRDCPDPLLLGEYQLGLLAEVEQSRLRAHLDKCPHCQAEFGRLVEFLAAAALPANPSPAAEEVAWTQEQGFKWRLGKVGQVIIHFLSETLPQNFSSLWQPIQPAYAMAKRGAEPAARVLGHLSLKEAGQDLEVTITAEPTRDDSTSCTLIVEVNIPSRGGWPHLANTEVILKQNETTLATRVTDAFGKAIFEEIALAELPLLAFEMTPHP